jgi:hypothetical protein
MRVIILNGSVNSGKTTTGRVLAQLLPGAVFIDGDDHGVPRSVPFEEMTELSLDWLIARVVEATAPVLVIARPLRDHDFVRLQAVTKRRGAELVVVTLAPPLAVAGADRGDRKLDAWERNRVPEMYAEGYASRAFSDLIVTDMPGPDVTARFIVEHLGL